MSKHTPGPWHIDGSKQEGLTVRAGQSAVAVIPGYGVGQRMEDARLIAAAPDILQALKDATDAIEHWGAYASDYFQQKWDLHNDINAARAAIAKAEGQT
jgi:hypothetical protein